MNALMMSIGVTAAGKAAQYGMNLPRRGDIVLSKPMAREIETTRRGMSPMELELTRGNALSRRPQPMIDAAQTPAAVAGSLKRQGKGDLLKQRANALEEPGKARAAEEVERIRKVQLAYKNQLNDEIAAHGGFDGWQKWLKESRADFYDRKRQTRALPNTTSGPLNKNWSYKETYAQNRKRTLDRFQRVAEDSVPQLPDMADILRENNRQRKIIRDVLKSVPEARTLSDADLDALVTMYMDSKAAEVASRVLNGNYKVKPGSDDYWKIAGLAMFGLGTIGAVGYNSLVNQDREPSPR